MRLLYFEFMVIFIQGVVFNSMLMNKTLCGMRNDDLFNLINPHGFERNHSTKVMLGIYRKRVKSISQIPGIPKSLKEFLRTNLSEGIYLPVASQISADDSIKYLFRNDEGLEFETVYLPDKKRRTICVSTQSGCRMGCPFCLTGQFGFRGNLSARDIINQVIGIPEVSDVSHVVFMGMGEPMDNLVEVLKACEILTSEWGLAISSRNITVSTVGILPGIMEFLKRSDCNLTVSLHSPFPDERKLVVPVENKYPVKEIIDILKSFPIVKKRRFSIAYMMIEGINDSENHLNALKHLLTGSRIRVNLLTYHRIGNEPNRSSSADKMLYFKHNLIISGISASIRKSRGEDISAACGLLASGLGRSDLFSL
jgi:23S rRNA (adenine2503-C2)-methyltransferase